ncbi:MAG TPA: DMT family transporter [Steroidobacteraceae bacterium]|jgi:drug/metabolite transporter (DMT)-like permease|nr:DMT family transporter [Steroidobacteraceae bacterium]
MPVAALLAVLLAACTHASWNLVAKKAARSTHFVWLYSMASLLLWTGPAIWVLAHTHWHPGLQPWLALVATALLHLAYSLALQSGYRAGDLSLVYPIARGTGPLLSFGGAALLLGERPGWIPLLGVLLVVSGIALVADLWRPRRHSPRAGILWGLITGACIASYTLNDGWAVKYLAISPILVDYSGNFFRAIVLARPALTNITQMRQEIREFGRAALVVGALGPLGYILVLWAMTLAPISHVAPARELATLVGTYFGSRLLKEHAGWSRVAGALCIVLGVICLAASDS